MLEGNAIWEGGHLKNMKNDTSGDSPTDNLGDDINDKNVSVYEAYK